jgi:hypothetical protein
MNTILFSKDGKTTEIPIGFSWTTFLFGFLPSALSGHWSFAFQSAVFMIVSLFCSIVVMHGQDAMLTYITTSFYLGSVRNVAFHNFMLQKGWVQGLPITTPQPKKELPK